MHEQTVDCHDPIDSIPEPDTVRAMIADAVRRLEILRSLLRVSQRKAAFRPQQTAEVNQ
jgi:hypothetical protein